MVPLALARADLIPLLCKYYLVCPPGFHSPGSTGWADGHEVCCQVWDCTYLLKYLGRLSVTEGQSRQTGRRAPGQTGTRAYGQTVTRCLVSLALTFRAAGGPSTVHAPSWLPLVCRSGGLVGSFFFFWRPADRLTAHARSAVLPTSRNRAATLSRQSQSVPVRPILQR